MRTREIVTGCGLLQPLRAQILHLVAVLMKDLRCVLGHHQWRIENVDDEIERGRDGEPLSASAGLFDAVDQVLDLDGMRTEVLGELVLVGRGNLLEP